MDRAGIIVAITGQVNAVDKGLEGLAEELSRMYFTPAEAQAITASLDAIAARAVVIAAAVERQTVPPAVRGT